MYFNKHCVNNNLLTVLTYSKINITKLKSCLVQPNCRYKSNQLRSVTKNFENKTNKFSFLSQPDKKYFWVKFPEFEPKERRESKRSTEFTVYFGCVTQPSHATSISAR